MSDAPEELSAQKKVGLVETKVDRAETKVGLAQTSVDNAELKVAQDPTDEAKAALAEARVELAEARVELAQAKLDTNPTDEAKAVLVKEERNLAEARVELAKKERNLAQAKLDTSPTDEAKAVLVTANIAYTLALNAWGALLPLQNPTSVQPTDVEFYYEAAKKVYAAPDIGYLSERSAEHFASFFFCWTNSLLLHHIKTNFPQYPDATITCVYDKNIPHLNQIGNNKNIPHLNQIGNKNIPHLNQIGDEKRPDARRPDAQFFLKLGPTDHKLRYLYGCEMKKADWTPKAHLKAAIQMINGVKLQSPTTNYHSIFATIVGTKAQLHSYSFIRLTHLADPYDLILLSDFKDFANELVETIINALEPEQYATPSSHPGTHLVCTDSPTPATRIHVLKCIRFPSNVIEVFRLSLSRLRVSKKDFVLNVQSTPFVETEKPSPSQSSQFSNPSSSISRSRSKDSMTNHHPGSPLIGAEPKTMFFSALFAYQPGKELGEQSAVVPSLDDFNTLLQKVHDLHKAGFVHNDIRQANIIVDHQGELHLIDFGYCLDKQQLKDRSQNIKDIATILHSLKVFRDVGPLFQMLKDFIPATPSDRDVEQLWKICVISDLYQITRLYNIHNLLYDLTEAQKSLLEYCNDSQNFDDVHSFKLD